MEQQNTQPKKFYQKRWFLITIALVAGLIILSRLTPKQTNNNSQTSSSTTSNTNTSIKISAEELMKEYEENEVAADQKYKNKIIEVSGVIETVGKLPPFDEPYVELLGKPKQEFSISNVQCLFSSADEKELTTLKKGNSVTLTGMGDGKLLVDVKLKNCKIVK